MARLEDLISEGLDQRVETLTRSPFSVDQIAGRARVVRRRRTALGAGVAALVLAAVAVPTTLAATGHRADSEPSPIATDSSKPSPSATPVAGPRLGIAYLAGRTVHLPDGSGVTLRTELPPRQFAHLTDGRFVVVTANGDGSRWRIAVTNATGVQQDSYASGSYSIVVNGDHTAAGWIASDGRPMVVESGRTAPVELARVASGPVHEPTPIALIGSECAADAETTAGAGCVMIGRYTNADFRPETFEVDSHGLVQAYAGPQGTGLSDVSADGTRSLEYDTASDLTSCEQVFDHETQTYGQRTCTYGYLRYGPGDRFVGGTDAMSDGPGPGRLYLMAADDLDHAVARTPRVGGVFHDWTFLDATHLVAVVDDGHGAAHLATLGADGTYDDLGAVGHASLDGTGDTFLEVQP